MAVKKLLCLLIFVGLAFAQPSYGTEDTDNDDDPAKAPPVSMNERVLNVPGDPYRPVTLEVTVLTPPGAGPFPLAVMNHGATDKHTKIHDPKEPRYHHTFSAYYFLSRGYAVALPMMRGFAGSGGEVENHGCDLATTGLNNAKDIDAVINYFKTQPYIDSKHIVVAGQSFGGFNALALGMFDDPDIKGLINFAGGLRVSSCNQLESSLLSAFSYFGSKSRHPSIWFYGDNDQVFPQSLWQAMHSNYTQAGGYAELVSYGSFMEDSHQLLAYPESLAIWTPKVDDFLNRIGMPSKLLYPDYLPVQTPQPTNYAAIDDAEAIPYLNDQGREVYQKYLSKKFPRALVISPKGSIYSQSGGFDPFGRAMRECAKSNNDCQPYAVDNYVVWLRPTPASAPTNFARIDDASAIPYLNEKARADYQVFLTKRRPRAFVIAPDGGYSASWSKDLVANDPIAKALEVCSRSHQGCQLYAVDNNVVWNK